MPNDSALTSTAAPAQDPATVAPVAAASTKPGQAAPGSASVAPGAPSTPPPAVVAPPAPANALGTPTNPGAPVAVQAPQVADPDASDPASPTPVPSERFLLVVDDGQPLDADLAAQAVAQAKLEKFRFMHFASVAHDTMTSYGRLIGLSQDGQTAYVAPVGNLNERREFPAGEVFSPQAAEAVYRELKAAPAPAPAAPVAVAGKVASMLMALLLPLLFALGGCQSKAPATAGNTPTAALPTPPASASQPAKIGETLLKIETPAFLQFQVQVAVAQVLQRAVAKDRQPVAAAYVTNAAKALRSFTGAIPPTADEVKARISEYAGPTQDPNLILLSATIADVWSLALPTIQDNATGAKVLTYANAAANGALAGSAGYLP